MPENLRPWVDAARERAIARPASPGVTFTEKSEGRWRIDAPHDDREAWELMICEAFGTRSHSTMWTFLDQLRGMMGERHNGEQWVPDEFAVNAALNMVNAAKPQNELEAALVAQMVAVHFMTMKAAQQHGSSSMLDPRDAAMIARLARTYAGQIETLGKLQGKVKSQNINVTYERHDHVHHHVHDERHVHLEGGGAGKRGQGFGPTLAESLASGPSRASLSRAEAERFALPEARDTGEGPLPDPRVRQGVGSAQGEGERIVSHGILDGGGNGTETPGVRSPESLPERD